MAPHGCSTSLDHWVAILLLVHLSLHPLFDTPSHPQEFLFHLSPFACVCSSCVGGRLELPETTTRITRSISETIFYFSHHLIHGMSLHTPPPLQLSLICSLWLMCVFTLCPSRHSLPLAEENETGVVRMVYVCERVCECVCLCTNEDKRETCRTTRQERVGPRDRN